MAYLDDRAGSHELHPARASEALLVRLDDSSRDELGMVFELSGRRSG